MSENDEGSKSKVKWAELEDLDKAIKERGGFATDEDVKQMLELLSRLDESTLPEGVRFPLGHQGESEE